MPPEPTAAGDPPRAVSPVIGTVLLVGVAVLLAAVVGVGIAGWTPSERPPVAAVDAGGPLLDDRPGDDGQRVRLEHAGGETLTVTDIDLAVDVPGRDRRTRLVGLPVTRDGLGRDDYRGDDLVDRRWYTFSGVALVGGGSPAWSAGRRLGFRIKHGGDGVRLERGDGVAVTVVHEPSGSAVSRVELTAR